MNKKSKTIDRCQISGVKDLKTILSLCYLPPVNKLKKINSFVVRRCILSVRTNVFSKFKASTIKHHS